MLHVTSASHHPFNWVLSEFSVENDNRTSLIRHFPLFLLLPSSCKDAFRSGQDAFWENQLSLHNKHSEVGCCRTHRSKPSCGAIFSCTCFSSCISLYVNTAFCRSSIPDMSRKLNLQILYFASSISLYLTSGRMEIRRQMTYLRVMG